MIKKATMAELKKLKKGDIVIVNIDDPVNDFAIFMELKEDGNIMTIDCVSERKFYNVAEYKKCAIIPDLLGTINNVLDESDITV